MLSAPPLPIKNNILANHVENVKTLFKNNIFLKMVVIAFWNSSFIFFLWDSMFCHGFNAAVKVKNKNNADMH